MANYDRENPLPVVVLISGRGSNLKALLDTIRQQQLPAVVRAVISNRGNAAGLQLARQAGIATQVLQHNDFSDRATFDRTLIQSIDRYQPGLVLLAGFMRLLTAEFVAHYAGRLLNIHPSLLPAYRGLHTHQRALNDGVSEHGASVHFVTAELDGGPVIVQATVPVLPSDNVATLAARVLEQEHIIYPLAVRWFAEGRLHLQNDCVFLDNEPLNEPFRLDATNDHE